MASDFAQVLDRAPGPETGFSYWNDNGSREPIKITIDLGAQAAYIYRGGDLIGRSRVATGKSSYRTPTGSFVLLDKQAEKMSNLYGRILDANGDVVNSDADARTDAIPAGGRYVGASMPYWMRLTSSGIGMHAGSIPNPGITASHGCIRMPRFMARQLFQSVPIGTPVHITP
jgi:lipoprotein-anchoring transpeptidase ErfK/SrfK